MSRARLCLTCPRCARAERRRRVLRKVLGPILKAGAVYAVLGVLAVPFVRLGCVGPGDLVVFQMDRLEQAISMYRAQTGAYPTWEQGLDALADGPWVDDPGLLLDPWGYPFQYFAPSRDGEREFEIVSYGEDGRPGGAGDRATADRTNWDG